jgi:hypothetical protein
MGANQGGEPGNRTVLTGQLVGPLGRVLVKEEHGHEPKQTPKGGEQTEHDGYKSVLGVHPVTRFRPALVLGAAVTLTPAGALLAEKPVVVGRSQPVLR